MAITEAERQELGRLASRARIARFRGQKKDVYTSADVNSATLDRIEQGLSVKERSLVAVVRTLWPSSDGDWRRVLDDARQGEPATPPTSLQSLTDEQLMGELARRLATRKEITPHGDPPSITRAGSAGVQQRDGLVATTWTEDDPEPTPQVGGNDSTRKNP